MYESKIDLPETSRAKVTRLLNERLADAIDLGAQTKHAHWNVKGPHFIALHELFDKVAENVEEHIDELAERITALGATAHGTIAHAARSSSLKPYPEDITEGMAHVRALSTALADFGARVRQGTTSTATSRTASPSWP